MAFVPGLPIPASRTTPSLSSRSALSSPVVTPTVRVSSSTPRMGYGDYSYTTDRTKGHVQQYYVDKFRIAADFVKGSPASAADAILGRNVKNGILVPKQGIPQVMDDALPSRDETVAPDPRIAESEGAVYPWDINYVDPAFQPSARSDINDETTADNAFAAFRSSCVEDRRASLSAMDFGAAARVNRILGGLDESYLLTLDGALDVSYARLQKIVDIPTLSPTGQPQTEIPGYPYLKSVGALDFQKKPGEEIAFWKTPASTVPGKVYKRPSGSDTPDLPYNTSATLDEMKEAQSARGLLPAEE